MTYQGQITAASPLALATSFLPPILGRDCDSAVVAVRKALDQLPEEVREGTLEEIAVREKTRELIATAKALLSPEFYEAFLRWGEAASHFSSAYDTDEEGHARCEANSDAVANLTASPVSNKHDQAVLGYLAALELADRCCFGPLLKDPDPQYLTDKFALSVVASSPVAEHIEELSNLLWSHSSPTSWNANLGAIVTEAFSSARGELSAELAAAPAPFARDLLDQRNAALAELNRIAGHSGEETPEEQELWATLRAAEDSIFNAPATPDAVFAKFMLAAHLSTEGHELVEEQTCAILADAQHVLENWPPRNPYMHGPLVNWSRAYERYSDVQAEVLAYQRDVIEPADDREQAVLKRYPRDFDFSSDPIAEAELAAVEYEAEEARMEELYEQSADALQPVLRLPAGSPAQLAIKLQLFVKDRAWEVDGAQQLMRQITADARRFAGLGAYLQTDEHLLNAYAGCRREMAEFLNDPGSQSSEEEDASTVRVKGAEEVIWGTRASTTEGVLAKLRVAFQHTAGLSWSDHSIVDPKHPEFRAGIKEADGNVQLLWSAIEDLARISGVSLSEQGA